LDEWGTPALTSILENAMTPQKTLKTGLFTLALALALTAPALADTTVKVKLWNKAGTIDMSKNMMLGMGMKEHMAGHMKMKAMMGIDINVKTVKAGKVTFEVTNTGKDMQHEMLVAPIKDENTVLPYKESESRVDEEASGDLGEVSELDPGKSGALTLDLKPGLYILFCNIPGHYTWGMWTTLKVE
jgi:uncharacterized cupredoxin-like copper-binding protein